MSRHAFPVTPKSYESVTSGTMFERISPLIEILSVSASPIVTSPRSIVLPVTSNPESNASPNTTSPAVPLNTSPVLVASGINVNLPVLSSKPKKPTFAKLAPPSYQLNSIPLSRLSSATGVVSPPNVKIGSSIVTVVLLTLVTVPSTCKSPATVKSPPMVVLPVAPAIVNSASVLPNLISPVAPICIRCVPPV